MGMEQLLRGHERFLQEVYPRERDLFEKLAGGQKPEVLLVTCSDSRVDPSLLTQTRPGDLFVIRNAGNLVPAYGTPVGGEGATLEYAVAALGVRHIVVCGHSGCGAMGGLLSPASLDALPQVRQWLVHAERTRQIVEDAHGNDSPEVKLARAIELNVLAQLDALRTHPPVAKAIARGELELHGWVYDIGSGRLNAYRPEDNAFTPLVDVPSKG
ncbi:MAG: carbonic anhydrase [Myxococcota bacterium]